MAKFEITGRTKLAGELKVSGAKNEVLKLIPLSVLMEGDFQINNAPRISDVFSQIKIYELLGGRKSFEGSKLIINSSLIQKSEVNQDLSSKLRASIVFAGSLLSKFGQTTIFCPGGCVIGARSIETHLDAFKQAGVMVSRKSGAFTLKVPEPRDKITVALQEKSVTASENIILYLCKGQHKAKVSNIAIEPEVIHLIETINLAGGKIKQTGKNEIEIDGVDALALSSVDALPDRIEAGTFAIAIAATGGHGSVYPYPAGFLESLTNKLLECGVNISIDGDRATISSVDQIRPFKIETAPYPGFPTDLQSPMSLIAAIANGQSHIKEAMFDNRLGYLNELKEMGLDVEMLNNHEAKITGPTDFVAKDMESLDLRSGITALIAAMMAEGTSVLNKAEMIDRGYENIETKLNQAGAKIVRSE